MHAAPGGQTGRTLTTARTTARTVYPGENTRTKRGWKSIAQLQGRTHRAGYDLLMNRCPNAPGAPKYKNLLEPLYKRTTSAIREIDKNT